MHVATEDSRLLLKLLAEARSAFSTPLHIPMENIALLPRHTRPTGSEQMVGLYLQQFLIQLIRKNSPVEAPSFLTSDDIDIAIPHSENPYVQEAIQFLIQNIGLSLSVDTICQAVGVGRSRLQQLFHHEFSCGVNEFFLRLKASAAKQLLMHQNLHVSEVAELLGFSSTAYFSSFFKEFWGRTPTQYRNAAMDISHTVRKLKP